MAAQNEKSKGEVFFAVGDEHCSVAEIAEKIIKVFNSGSLKFIDWPLDRKATEIGDAVISNAKIKKILLWNPEYNLNSALLKQKIFI